MFLVIIDVNTIIDVTFSYSNFKCFILLLKKSYIFALCYFLSLIGFNVLLLRFQALIICRGALYLLKHQLSRGILFFKQDASCNTLVYIGCICILMLELYATFWRNLCRVWKFNLWLCSFVQWYQKSIVFSYAIFLYQMCLCWFASALTFCSDLFFHRHICLMAVQVLVQVLTQLDRTLLLLLLMHLLMPDLVRYNESYISR